MVFISREGEGISIKRRGRYCYQEKRNVFLLRKGEGISSREREGINIKRRG